MKIDSDTAAASISVMSLPPELLELIFVLSVSSENVQRSMNTAMGIASVCSQWRALALSPSMQCLWIYISLHVPQVPGYKTTDKLIHEVKEGLAGYLDRSGSQSLTIDLNFDDDITPIHNAILPIIFRERYRWERATFPAAHQGYMWEGFTVDPVPLSRLEYLNIAPSVQYEYFDHDGTGHKLKLMQAPRLRYARIPHLSDVSEFRWENMQILHLHNSDLFEVAKLFGMCKLLAELYLDSAYGFWGPLIPLPDNFLAKNLKVLQLTGNFHNDGDDDHVLYKILQRLDAPNLSDLRAADLRGTELLAVQECIKRGRNGEGFRELELDVSYEARTGKLTLAGFELGRILSYVPSLTDLMLCEHRVPVSNRIWMSEEPKFLVPPFFETMCKRDREGQFRILPWLKRLTIHITGEDHFRGALKSFLEARCTPPSALTRVNVIFDKADTASNLFQDAQWGKVEVRRLAKWYVSALNLLLFYTSCIRKM